MKETINIREIQHYLYCAHRWGLIAIELAWVENYYVTKADLIHERVHSNISYSAPKHGRVYTAVKVWNDDRGMIGEVDCLEESRGQFTIVEYKPTQPKDKPYHAEDLLQVFAQKICVDHIFRCNASAEIYYADTKKRAALPVIEKYAFLSEKLTETLNAMRAYLECGEVPPVTGKEKCGGCSFRDICLPAVFRKHSSTKAQVMELVEGV